ncbi:hypothetical protein Vadar_032643 [Vaccinium darrowii]|uniref:Uncharacterized protein n=1 Tax=Vaccinium darrowii TaxID=229202 RepID=A0ACB7YSF5_9ERIC|nr:hypothetical protein Vadar_032643 [Vaccinium darrowii]
MGSFVCHVVLLNRSTGSGQKGIIVNLGLWEVSRDLRFLRFVLQIFITSCTGKKTQYYQPYHHKFATNVMHNPFGIFRSYFGGGSLFGGGGSSRGPRHRRGEDVVHPLVSLEDLYTGTSRSSLYLELSFARSAMGNFSDRREHQ